jgi:hypothetical protein
MSAKVNIIKSDGDGEIGEHRTGYTLEHVVPTYAMPSGPGGGARKTRTYPKGIIRKKIVPSKNPTKSPPTRKRAVLLVSSARLSQARKTAKAAASKTDLATIRAKLTAKKIISSEKKKIDPAVLRTLYADAVGAGLLN